MNHIMRKNKRMKAEDLPQCEYTLTRLKKMILFQTVKKKRKKKVTGRVHANGNEKGDKNKCSAA